MKFGDYIKQLREQHELTQPEAAKRAEIEQSYLSKLETGRSYPSEEIFNRLVQTYNISLEDLQSQLNPQELEKLGNIKNLKEIYISNQKAEVRAIRGWLIVGMALLMLSGAFLATAHLHSGAQPEYLYRSLGVTAAGEPIDAFSIIEQSDPELSQEQQKHKQHMVDRLSPLDSSSETFKGDYYIENVEKGKRTYMLLKSGEKASGSKGLWFLIPGLAFLFGALASFVISFRWR